MSSKSFGDRPHLHNRDGRLYCRECGLPITITPDGHEAGHSASRRGLGRKRGRCSYRPEDRFEPSEPRGDQDHDESRTREREKKNRSLDDY